MMAEKIRKSEQKKHKSKRKRKKRCSHSDDENLTVETPNCKERLRKNLDETKRDMHRKHETSSDLESSKHDAEHTLQQSFINKSTLKHFNQVMHSELINKTTILNCDQISQSQRTFCSSLDDNISRTNDGSGKCDGKTIRWENCCNNPIKEMQRIEKYKADRRQRYYDQAKSKQTTSRYYARI